MELKKENLFFFEVNFFKHLCFILMYRLLNKLSEYIYLYISQNITSCISWLVFRSSESLCAEVRSHGMFLIKEKLLVKFVHAHSQTHIKS